MSKFDLKMDKKADQLHVHVSGVIDEDVDFTGFPLGDAKDIQLHLQSVKSINSCGIREWIKWLGSSAATAVTFHECPKIIVDQINMVEGFLPANGKVQSFFVPYYSDDSGEEKMVLFSRGKEFDDRGFTAPAEVKDDSGAVMEMDVIEAKYFKFLKK